MSPARAAALRVYETVVRGTATLPDALAIAQAGLEDPRDRALTVEIATGMFRWQAALDHALAAHVTRPLDRIDAIVLGILRLSAYQLLFLNRIPPRAVVYDAVALTRDAKKQSASGFVNAVLRRVAEADRDALWPAKPDGDGAAALDYLSITLSHPRWLAARWLERHGFEAAEAWARFDNAPAALTLRANRLQVTREDLRDRLADQGVATDLTSFAPDGLIVRAGHPLQMPVAHQGLFTTQDEASQLVASLAQAAVPARSGSAPLRVLDTCAAPGGKTLALASTVGPDGIVIATDRRKRRIRLLHDSVTAAHATQVHIAQLDLDAALPFRGVFDLVLVDAPCSGLGTIRREPEIRWRRTEDDLPRFAERQRRMLDHAAHGVRPGGRLVYATCSSEPEENEEVVAAFLADHPAFRALPAQQLVLPPALASVIDEAGHLRTWPFLHGLEAFFAAVFDRVFE